jgi:hypothetical protein
MNVRFSKILMADNGDTGGSGLRSTIGLDSCAPSVLSFVFRCMDRRRSWLLLRPS